MDQPAVPDSPADMPAQGEPVDWGHRAQRAAERVLSALEEAEFDGTPLPPDIEVDAPFCGCQTCVVREVLNAGWPHMVEGAKEELDNRNARLRDTIERLVSPRSGHLQRDAIRQALREALEAE